MICDNESELKTRRTIAIVLLVVLFIVVWYFIAIKPLLALFAASSHLEPNILHGDQQTVAMEQLQQKAVSRDMVQVSTIGKLKTRFINMREELKANLSESR